MIFECTPQTSVAVLFAEFLKIVFCLITLLFLEQGPISLYKRLKADIWDRKWDTLKASSEHPASPYHALCTNRARDVLVQAAQHARSQQGALREVVLLLPGRSLFQPSATRSRTTFSLSLRPTSALLSCRSSAATPSMMMSWRAGNSRALVVP
eukprot:3380257-Pleurochrysis_carterae.AAC.1